MLRWMTAGESHGQSLVGILEGIPAGVKVCSQDISNALARRRLGYGRGARMKFEADKLHFSGGVRHGLTMGSPIAIIIENTEWPKWKKVMSADPIDQSEIEGKARNAPLTRPRPGHADLTGMQKYGFDEARNVLERASARETATRVALGEVAALFLAELGIQTVAHTVSIAEIFNDSDMLPEAKDQEALDQDPLRCFNQEISKKMVQRIDQAHKEGQTLGGVVEVLVYGLPPGLGSYSQWDTRLESRLSAALMGIQAIKAVEIGDGFTTATRNGGMAHDEITHDAQNTIVRATDRAGGIEGGMSNGEILRIRAAMKPIATVPKALKTIDTETGEATKAHHQRSDVCAVPAAGVVAQAMVNLAIADAVLEKFGGDNVAETQRNLNSYRENIPENLRTRGV
ncbi:MAG: chorismate synthase [Micrococcaceae bacterium]